MTLPCTPCGTRSEVSFTSRAFSPKIARSRRSSAVSSVSPFGVILPTRMSFGLDLGADADDAVLVEVAQAVLADVRDVAGDLLRPELGVARLDLVLLDVDRGEHVVAHQPLADQDGVLEVAALPGHEGDQHVLAERQLARPRSRTSRRAICPSSTRSPRTTIGRWLMQVSWFERTNLCSVVDVLGRRRRRGRRSARAVDATRPRRRVGDTTTWPESRAACCSMPVPTIGARGCSSGTAWRCMFAPIRARLASSCSRNGISAVATETTCFGERPCSRPARRGSIEEVLAVARRDAARR